MLSLFERYRVGSRRRAISPAGLVLIGIALCLALRQLWFIHTSWTAVGFVDTWPLYDRLMLLKTGRISMDHYLLDPHGLHLHFIVYFLYLVDFLLGGGRQIVPHLATIVSIVGLVAICCYLFQCLAAKHPLDMRAAAALGGMFILMSGVSEATLIPFQAVVVVTRCVHVLLLLLFATCQFVPERRLLYAVSLSASCVAALFYGSGALFAAAVILIHTPFYFRRNRLALSALPLLTYMTVAAVYVKPGAETQATMAVIRGLNAADVGEILLGSVCYYASALFVGWPGPIRTDFAVSEFILLGIAAVVCGTTVTWAVWRTVSFFRQEARKTVDVRKAAAELVMAAMALFVFASSVSAAVLWMARARIFGPALGMKPHFAVWSSNRYSAFSALAFFVALYVVAFVWKSRVGAGIAVALFVVIAVCGFASFGRPERRIDPARIQLGATALLMGFSPADEEASSVWPGVGDDRYWAEELKSATEFIRRARISFAYGMPVRGQVVGDPQAKVYDATVQPIAASNGVCRLSGTELSVRPTLFFRERFFPVTNRAREVVGFAILRDGAVRGHLSCKAAEDSGGVYLSVR